MLNSILTIVSPTILVIVGAAAGFFFNRWTQILSIQEEKRKTVLSSLDEVDRTAEEIKYWAKYKSDVYWIKFTPYHPFDSSAYNERKPECPLEALLRTVKFRISDRELYEVANEYSVSVEAIRTGIEERIYEFREAFDEIHPHDIEDDEDPFILNQEYAKILRATFDTYEKSHTKLLATTEKLAFRFNTYKGSRSTSIRLKSHNPSMIEKSSSTQ